VHISISSVLIWRMGCQGGFWSSVLWGWVLG
jgi:hypothetical protein